MNILGIILLVSLVIAVIGLLVSYYVWRNGMLRFNPKVFIVFFSSKVEGSSITSIEPFYGPVDDALRFATAYLEADNWLPMGCLCYKHKNLPVGAMIFLPRSVRQKKELQERREQINRLPTMV